MKHKSFKICRVRSIPIYGQAYVAPRLLRVDFNSFDIVHLHYPYFMGAHEIWLASLAKSFSYILTYHMDVLKGPFLEPALRLHDSTVLGLILKRSSKIFASSFDYISESRIGKLFVQDPWRFAEIPLAVDRDNFQPIPPDPSLLSKLGFNPNDKVVLFVGALDRAHGFKGLDILMRAFAIIHEPRARLAIVGDGPLKPSFMRLARKLNLLDRTKFLGLVPHDMLPLVYSFAAVVVVPSKGRGEAFSMVALEAMAAGKPVIASRLPGVRSLVRHSDNGFLFSPGDYRELAEEMDTLLSDPNMALELGNKGRENVLRYYSWQVVREKILREYERCRAN